DIEYNYGFFIITSLLIKPFPTGSLVRGNLGYNHNRGVIAILPGWVRSQENIQQIAEKSISCHPKQKSPIN
ncbi:hypothetical protein J7L05_05570, partial [bacterium]|nr:hypothetical protein [bacterium]